MATVLPYVRQNLILLDAEMPMINDAGGRRFSDIPMRWSRQKSRSTGNGTKSASMISVIRVKARTPAASAEGPLMIDEKYRIRVRMMKPPLRRHRVVTDRISTAKPAP